MTRTEIEQDIRSVTRICKGDPALTTSDQQALRAQWDRVEIARNWAAALIFKRSLEKGTGFGDAPIPADDWDAMFSRVSGIIYGYKFNCGYDINNLILSEPLDGVRHETPCPGCGRTIGWTPAIYE